MKKTALVTGATGFIGKQLVYELLSLGHRVIAISRKQENIFPAEVIIIRGDLANKQLNEQHLLSGVDIVFHCAGELANETNMFRLHVEGTQFLLDKLLSFPERSRPLHWVQLSSVGAYGPPPIFGLERVVTEASPERPMGDYERTKTASDHIVMNSHLAGNITWSVLRPSNVIGVEMPNNSVRGMVRMIKKGLFFYVGKSGSVANYVHVRDVIQGLIFCAFNPLSKGEIFNLSCDCTFESMVEQIAQSLKVSSPCIRLPGAPMRMVASLLESIAVTPLSSSRVNALINRTRYPSTKIEQVLKFKFQNQTPRAFEELVVKWSGD